MARFIHDEASSAHLPPMLGLEDEIIIMPINMAPHYTALLNGCRVYVWGDAQELFAEVKEPDEVFGNPGRILVTVPNNDPIALRAVLEDITSGGNENV